MTEEVVEKNFVQRLIDKLNSINFGLDEEKEYFMENLSMLLASGISINAALDSIKEGMAIPYMRKLVDDMKNDIEGGMTMWKAFDKTGLFSGEVLALFRIGEESGRLSENLKMINEQQQKARSFRAKIKSAMMYPVLVLILTLVIGIGIAWFILPRLSGVFTSLRLELPAITKALIWLGNFLGEYGAVVIPIFLVFLGIVLYFVFLYEKTKFIGQAFLMKLPGISDLIKYTELSRFGYVLGQLLSSNIPVVDSIESLRSSTDILKYQAFYEHLKIQIGLGHSFQESFALYPTIDDFVPAPIQQMIATGEQSGCLPKILLKVGEVFEEKADNTTKNLSVILEPLLLVVVWGGVVSVALAVILPIYSLIGGVGKKPTPPPKKPVVEESVSEDGGMDQLSFSGNVDGGGSSPKDLNQHGQRGKTDAEILLEDGEADQGGYTFEKAVIREGVSEDEAIILTSYEGVEGVLEQAEGEIAESVAQKHEISLETVDVSGVDDEVDYEDDDEIEIADVEEVEVSDLEVFGPFLEVGDVPEVVVSDDLVVEEKEEIGVLDEVFVEVEENGKLLDKILSPFRQEDVDEEVEVPVVEVLDNVVVEDMVKEDDFGGVVMEEGRVKEVESVSDVEGDEVFFGPSRLRFFEDGWVREEVLGVSSPVVTRIRVNGDGSITVLDVDDVVSGSGFVDVVSGVNLLNVREMPSLDSTILRQVHAGERYSYVDVEGGWYRIAWGEGRSGWVFGGFVEVVE